MKERVNVMLIPVEFVLRNNWYEYIKIDFSSLLSFSLSAFFFLYSSVPLFFFCSWYWFLLFKRNVPTWNVCSRKEEEEEKNEEDRKRNKIERAKEKEVINCYDVFSRRRKWREMEWTFSLSPSLSFSSCLLWKQMNHSSINCEIQSRTFFRFFPLSYILFSFFPPPSLYFSTSFFFPIFLHSSFSSFLFLFQISPLSPRFRSILNLSFPFWIMIFGEIKIKKKWKKRRREKKECQG